jgi:peptidoglycan/LPS O-acetylase OafA/YrhL
MEKSKFLSVNRCTDQTHSFGHLDGIRFVAAALVLIFHIEVKKDYFGLPTFFQYYFFSHVGFYAVTLFFVLSGFLITYLLLTEIRSKGTLNISNFYMRRILRIWPLYFIIVLSAFFLWRQIPFFSIPGYESNWGVLTFRSLLWYIFFLPNIAHIIYGNILYLDQTWTIGIEEQFYLIWPVLIKFFRKHILQILFIIIGLTLLLKIVGTIINRDFFPCPLFVQIVFLSRFGCMAIGGVAAYLHINHGNFLKPFFNNKIFQGFIIFVCGIILLFGLNRITFAAFCILLIAIFVCSKPQRHYIYLAGGTGVLLAGIMLIASHHPLAWIYRIADHEIHAAVFALIIYMYANITSPLIRLDLKPLRYLGKISYSIYMLHNLLIVCVIKLMLSIDIKPGSVLSNIFIYGFSFLFSIMASALSYELIESRFLRLKKYFNSGAGVLKT